MSWFTLSGYIFLNGVLLASASGAIGLNYRKNGVFNTGLAGIVYAGTLISDILGRMMGVNPYWSVPLSIAIGSILNLALNVLFLDMMNKTGDKKTVNAVSIAAAILLYLIGRLLFSLFRSQYGLIMILNLISLDLTLFQIPGIIIVSVTLLLFTLLLQFVLSPVVEDRGLTRFDKWDYIVYGLAGAIACLAGALYRFWFVTSPIVLLVVVTSALFGGVDKKLNPYIGGFLSSLLWTGLAVKGQEIIGVWISDYSFVILIILVLVSIPFFPKGIVGRFRKIVEYKY